MRSHVCRRARIFIFALLAASILGAGATHAVAVIETELAGASRFETAIEISEAMWVSGSTGVIIATGMNWPDALGGATLVNHVQTAGPILLVKQDSIPGDVWAEIERLDPDVAIILGGTSAVGDEVEAQLEGELGEANVVRLAGANRYGTANAIASYGIDLDNALGAPYNGMAFVATGGDFPDSLTVGPLSAWGQWPIFLANPHTEAVPIATMKAKGVTEVVVLGGTKAVSQAQQDALEDAFGESNVTRITGENRYVTGTRISQWGVANGLDWDDCLLTTGENFPDALAGGPFAGIRGSVLLITPTNELHDDVAATLATNKTAINQIYYLGGTTALSQAVRDEVRSILQ